MEEILRLLTEGMEYILIPCRYQELSFELPACRSDEGAYYRIPHKALLYFYREVQKKYNIHIKIDKDVTLMTQGYCVAGCYLQTENDVSDIHIGENKISFASTDAERTSPFCIAMNRAQDKVITKEVFGLLSRIYRADGTPVIYGIDDMEILDDVNQPKVNSLEMDEFERLSAVTITYTGSDGQPRNKAIGEMKEAMLQYIDQMPDADGTHQQEKSAVHRYLELKAKMQ